MADIAGRWTITRRIASASSGDDWHIAVGPDPGPERKGVQVVPCDAEAVERVAAKLAEIQGYHAGPLAIDRRSAVELLRAAGES